MENQAVWVIGADVKLGDLINAGISKRIGRVTGFIDHPEFMRRHGESARVVVTDRGNITIPDNQPVKIY